MSFLSEDGDDDDEQSTALLGEEDDPVGYGSASARKRRITLVLEGAENDLRTSKISSVMSSVNHLRTNAINILSISTLAKPSSDRQASTLMAGWNVSILVQGTGTLGIPFAVMQTGWAGLPAILFIAFITCHTGKLIGDCLYEESKKTGIRRRIRTDLPEIAAVVWRSPGYVFVSVVQCIEMVGCGVMYLVLLGTAWNDMLHKSVPTLGVKEWAAISCLIALPSLFIRRLSILSWFSLIAVFAFMSSLTLIIVFSLINVSSWRLDNMPAFNFETFPIGFAMIVFTNCAHPILANVEASMRKPQSYGTVLNLSFALSAVLKIMIALAICMLFGQNTQELATSCMKSFPIWWYAINSLIVFNVLLAIPVCMFAISHMFDSAFLLYFPRCGEESRYHWVWLLVTRPILLTLPLVLGVAVPYFGLIIAVIGSFTGTLLSIILPAYFHMRIRWKELKWYTVAFDMFIIAFGFVVMGFGLFFSGQRLVSTLTR